MRHKLIRLYEFIEQDKSFQEFKVENESLGDNKNELQHLTKVIIIIIRNELTEKQRQCLCKYILDRKSMKEISNEMGTCVATVSRHIKRAKLRILKYLRYSKAVDKYVSSKTFDD